MYILAFDTATKIGSLAITNEDQLIIALTIKSNISHSKRLLPQIEFALKQTSLTLQDLDGFGVTIGPGSFTGLRIGLSVAKGLSYATGKPLVGVSTLEAMAAGLPFVSRMICPVLDARKGEVYAGFFKYQGQKLVKLGPEIVCPPKFICQYIHEPVVFLGDGVRLYRELFLQELPEKAFFALEGRTGPVAACVATLAYERITEGKVDDTHVITPHYIRRSEAEIKTNFSDQDKGGIFMWESEDELIDWLKKEDREFCFLFQEHQYLEKKLEKLNKLRYLTPEEEIERKTIQKKKLLGKDKMAEIIRKYKGEKVHQD
jgi:tRNA threonylcarbamoyladenosine biosynthesis protein TsaB